MRVDINSCDMSTSTLTANNVDVRKYESYEKVETLLFNEICQMPCQGFLTFNIVRLILNTDLPTSWYFLLNNLRHLEFRRNVHMSATDFAHFLTNAPQLQSLTLLISVLIKLTDSFTNKAVCDQLSKRIQSLTISDCLSNHDYGQNMEPIHIISNIVRIFGNTCEHLSLNLATAPQTVLPILGNMRQLHSLHIHYLSWRCKSYIPATSWFQQSTSETDVSAIIYTPDDLNFYIWFGKQR